MQAGCHPQRQAGWDERTLWRRRGGGVSRGEVCPGQQHAANSLPAGAGSGGAHPSEGATGTGSSSSGSSRAGVLDDGGGAATATPAADNRSEDGEACQPQTLGNCPASRGGDGKLATEGVRAGESSQFLTRLCGQLTDSGGHFQADEHRQRTDVRKACGQCSALSRAGHCDGLGCGQSHFCRFSAGIAPRRVTGFFGAQRSGA